MAGVYVTVLFTPIVENYRFTFYFKFKNLIIEKIYYIICALLLVFNNDSIYIILQIIVGLYIVTTL